MKTTVISGTRSAGNQSGQIHARGSRPYWHLTPASCNGVAAVKATQSETALVDVRIDAELSKYVNFLTDRGISTLCRSRADLFQQAIVDRRSCRRSSSGNIERELTAVQPDVGNHRLAEKVI